MRAAWCGVGLVVSCALAAQDGRVLFLTHSAGFVHPVVKRVELGKKSLAEQALAGFAPREFAVTATQDCGDINGDNLRNYDAVAFYTTGELPISDAGRAALLAFVRGGGGFVGIHSATDTFHQVAEYGEMIGGWFDGHPWHQPVGVRVENRLHPATALLGGRFEIHDEIYQFRDFSRERVEVLLSLDPSSVELDKGRRDDGDYALAWCRDFGEGRVFYTALGHRPEVWVDPRFRNHLLGGLRWVTAPRIGARRPPAARMLFDGSDASAWVAADGGAMPWKVSDGALVCVPGSGSIVTREPLGSCRLHVEFRIPDSDGKDQDRGNSGVYVQQRYEVQILDSVGRPPASDGCAALYRKRAPDANVCAAAEVWQTYDIWFTAPAFDADGRKQRNARFTVVHNGVTVHDDVELDDKTGAGAAEGPQPGRLLLQDHGHAVAFRNLWVQG